MSVPNPLLVEDATERGKLFERLASADADVSESELFNIARLMVEKCIRYPDRLCMSFSDGMECTFGQMLACASDVYAVLKKSGLEEEDRLFVTVRPGFVFYATVIAAWCLGLVIIVIDKGNFSSISRINHCVGTASPKAWLRIGTEFWYAKWLFSAIRAIPIILELPSGIKGSFLRESTQLSPSDVSNTTNALVTFTSGSTGLPKLLLRQHSFLMRQILSLATSEYAAQSVLCAAGNDRVNRESVVTLCNLPVAALYFIVVGAPCVLETNILGSDMAAVVARCRSASKAIGSQQCDAVGSPAFVERVVRHCKSTGEPSIIHSAYLGGAPVYSRLAQLLDKELQHARVVYGSTEAEPISSIFLDEKFAREAAAPVPGGHCVGQPHFSGSVAIIKDHEGQVPKGTVLEDLQLGAGEPGEIVLRGWTVNMNQVPEKRLLLDKEGRQWLRMDDGGYLDEDGYIWLVGRMSWKVERNGKTFWSFVVEEKVLKQSSKISYVTYLQRNSKAYLFIEAADGLPDAEKKSLDEMLLREQIPVDELRVMKTIPRDHRHASKPNTGALFAPPSLWKHVLLLVGAVLLLMLLFWLFV